MPQRPNQQQRQQQGQARASVVRPQDGPGRGPDGPSRALVAVTHEIDNRLAIVRASAAAGINADRLKLVALTVFTRTPALLECEPVSVARAIVEAAQLGLEPTGLLGGAYLVPRGGKATLLVGYKGLVILAKRSGEVQRVEARVVREKDFFEYEYGLNPRLVHRPSRDADPGKFTDAYAVIHYREGEPQFDVMSIAEIEAIRGRSSSPNAGPWVTDYAEMCKKTPLRRLMKLAPLSVEVAAKLDEIDPETDDRGPVTLSTREAELRQELQDALVREYGTAPEIRQLAAEAGLTTNGGGAGATAAQAGQATEDARASSVGGQAEQGAAASTVAAAPAKQSKPEAVGGILGGAAPTPAALCGATFAALDAGPCILPDGHDAGAWRDAKGEDHPLQNEHEQANGVRWTQPKGAK